MRPAVIAFALACLASGAPLFASKAEEQRAPVSIVPIQDPAMAAAFAKAHASLDDFLAKLAHPVQGTEHYAVKVGIKDQPEGRFAIMRPGAVSGTEYFWIGDLKVDGAELTGAVHNDPEVIRNVSLNQQIRFSRDDVADWTYFDRGRMKGNFTACPALAHSPKAMAEMREQLGLACD